MKLAGVRASGCPLWFFSCSCFLQLRPALQLVVQGKLSSAVGFKGLLKKVMIFVLVMVGTIVDKAIPAANHAIRSAVIMFYIANEGLSILENAGELGLPLPKMLKSALEKMKDEKPEDVPVEEQE